MASSDVPPNSKRSADYLESPASTSKARAVHVMEVNQQDEQGGASNRSGGVLANDETTKPWAWNPCRRPPEKRRRAICVVCKRVWMSRACYENIACFNCGKRVFDHVQALLQVIGS